MNKNTEVYFSQIPSVNIERSIFDLSVNHKLSGNFGRLIPFYVQEVLPGDTFKVDTSIVCRLQTLLSPVMDDAFLEFDYFYVRNALLWTHWKNFMGENTQSAWLDPVTYSPPLLSYPSGGFASGTIADYMGVPVGVASSADADKPLALPFRAYALICNEFWRDQNLTDPLNIPLGDSNQTGTNGDSYINDVANGGMPFKVAKFHDYFTSCTPDAQRSPSPVTIPLSKEGVLPVVPSNTKTNLITPEVPVSWNVANKSGQTKPLRLSYSGNTEPNADPILGYELSGTPSSNTGLYPLNLFALDNSSVAASINDLRLAFQLQRHFEKLSYGGSRYRETLQTFFGVRASDQSMMIPEYLGGKRVPIVIHQVANQAESASANLGDLGAMSNTSVVDDGSFVKSFTEHGYVIGVLCLRTNRSYSQGLDRFWSRRTREEWYWPTFAHLGNMAVKKREIYLSNDPDTNDAAFGYQEAWADYRYRRSLISGELRPGVSNSLAHWHFGDYYQSAPSLSDSWIREDPAVVDRALAVTSSVADQFFCDIEVHNIATRPLPLYSVPGLIDHF